MRDRFARWLAEYDDLDVGFMIAAAWLFGAVVGLLLGSVVT